MIDKPGMGMSAQSLTSLIGLAFLHLECKALCFFIALKGDYPLKKN
jgi:hypothetical protein